MQNPSADFSLCTSSLFGDYTRIKTDWYMVSDFRRDAHYRERKGGFHDLLAQIRHPHRANCTNPPHFNVFPPPPSAKELSFRTSDWCARNSEQLNFPKPRPTYSSKPHASGILLERLWRDRQDVPKRQLILTSWRFATAQNHQIVTKTISLVRVFFYENSA